MSTLVSKLRNKAELWGMVDGVNELGEIKREPGRIKYIYCDILPAGYSTKETKVTTRNEHTHKFTCRLKSIPDPKLDMYFMHEGLKYEFLSWDVDFKNRQFLNIFTEQIIE